MSGPRVGKIFQDRFLILDEIGAGGMGQVFKAKQLDQDREVALKLLRQEKILDEESIARFYREFKLLNRLHHPNVMQVYAMALDEAKCPFAVCEYLEGKSLRGLISTQEYLPWERALKIAVQIAGALKYIHENGIIHRDLKPENIILLERPTSDFVKLVDFGLSNEFTTPGAVSESGNAAEAAQKLTMTGQLLGSVFYMSPELASKRADARSDIYAFGCVLFEMLAGEPLFAADTAAGALYRHMNDDPSPRFASIRDKTPAIMFDLLSRCLEKSPARRYQTVDELLEDLNGVADQSKNLVSGKGYKYKGKGANLGKIASISGAVLLIILLGAYLVIKLTGKSPVDLSNDLARSIDSQKIRRQRFTLEDVDFVSQQLANPLLAGRVSLQNLQMLSLDMPTMVAEAVGDEKRIKLLTAQADFMIEIARREVNLQHFGDARRILDAVGRMMERLHFSPNSPILRKYYTLACDRKSPRDLMRVVSFAEQSTENMAGEFNQNLFAISGLTALKKYKEAEELIDKSIPRLRPLQHKESLFIALAYKARLLKSTGKDAESAKVNSELVQLIATGDNSLIVADAAQLTGDDPTALILLQDGIPRLETMGNIGMRVLPECVYLLQALHKRMGDRTAALQDCDRLLALYDKYGNLFGVPPKNIILAERAALES